MADFSGGAMADFSGGAMADFSGGAMEDFSGGSMTGGFLGMATLAASLAAPAIIKAISHAVKKRGGSLPSLNPQTTRALGDHFTPYIGEAIGRALMSGRHYGAKGAMGPFSGGARGYGETMSTGHHGVGGMGMFDDYKFGDITRKMLGKERPDKWDPDKLKVSHPGQTGKRSATQDAIEAIEDYMKTSGKGGRKGKKAKSSAKSRAAKSRAATNPWMAHVKQTRSENPGMSFKEVLMKAKSTY
jgi:hypothetical protein